MSFSLSSAVIVTSVLASAGLVMARAAWPSRILPVAENVVAWQSTVALVCAGALGGALVVGLVAMMLTRRQLKAYGEAAREIASGDLKRALPASADGELDGLVHSFNHIAEELRSHIEHHRNQSVVLQADAETALEREAMMLAQLRAAYDASRAAIAVIGVGHDLIAANSLMHSFFGTEEGDAMDVKGWVSKIATCFAEPGLFETQWKAFSANPGAKGQFELEITQPKARTLILYTAPVTMEDGRVIARLWNFRDITEQRKLEYGLRQAQKMDAIGHLAGAVAHDFNNLLTGIMGNLELVASEDGKMMPEEERVRRVGISLKTAQRGALIVRQLLGFSRQSQLNIGHCSIRAIMNDLMGIVTATFDPRIIIKAEVSRDIWALWADPVQVEQVVMNLLVNARDAMPDGGNIDISIKNVRVLEGEAATDAESKPGEYVCVSVQDSGCGMPADVKARIFEPFYTTKPQGKGTGLGLATAFGIVEQHGGWMSVDSAQGQGTIFKVCFPRSAQQILLETSKVPVSEPVPVAAEASKFTILVVDDEDVVRAIPQSLLTKQGYRVITASDGEEALATLARHDGEIDLVMLDLTMPRMSGREVFAAMRRGVAPTIPVIICSGYLVDVNAFETETGYRPDAVVNKPYPLAELASTVKALLTKKGRVAQQVT